MLKQSLETKTLEQLLVCAGGVCGRTGGFYVVWGSGLQWVDDAMGDLMFTLMCMVVG